MDESTVRLGRVDANCSVGRTQSFAFLCRWAALACEFEREAGCAVNALGRVDDRYLAGLSHSSDHEVSNIRHPRKYFSYEQHRQHFAPADSPRNVTRVARQRCAF